MALKGAIFDLDGVIVDTVPLHFEAWQRMFHRYGYAFNETDYKAKVDGRKREDGARAVMTDASEAVIMEASNYKQSLYLDLVAKGRVERFPSTIALIEDLVARKVKIAVASSSRNVAAILESIGATSLVDVIVNGGDLRRGKPEPEIFLNAANGLGEAVPGCIVFEDANAGVEAAKRGDFVCVGVDRDDNPQNLARADVIVKDLGDIAYDHLCTLLKAA